LFNQLGHGRDDFSAIIHLMRGGQIERTA
jgi:hypothetical protein